MAHVLYDCHYAAQLIRAGRPLDFTFADAEEFWPVIGFGTSDDGTYRVCLELCGERVWISVKVGDSFREQPR